MVTVVVAVLPNGSVTTSALAPGVYVTGIANVAVAPPEPVYVTVSGTAMPLSVAVSGLVALIAPNPLAANVRVEPLRTGRVVVVAFGCTVKVWLDEIAGLAKRSSTVLTPAVVAGTSIGMPWISALVAVTLHARVPFASTCGVL